MLYVRGTYHNYDEWAKQGAVGWSYSDVKPYFLKMEDNKEPDYLANGKPAALLELVASLVKTLISGLGNCLHYTL